MPEENPLRAFTPLNPAQLSMPVEYPLRDIDVEVRKSLVKKQDELRKNLDALQKSVPDKQLPDMRYSFIQDRVKPGEEKKAIQEDSDGLSTQQVEENAKTAHTFGWAVDGLLGIALKSSGKREEVEKTIKGFNALEYKFLPKNALMTNSQIENLQVKENQDDSGKYSKIADSTRSVLKSAQETGLETLKMLNERLTPRDIMEEEMKEFQIFFRANLISQLHQAKYAKRMRTKQADQCRRLEDRLPRERSK